MSTTTLHSLTADELTAADLLFAELLAEKVEPAVVVDLAARRGTEDDPEPGFAAAA